MIEYRIITEADSNAVGHLGWKAFEPDKKAPQPAPEPREKDPDEVYFGAFVDGRLGAQVGIIDRECLVRGANLRFGGIGGVATLPEYRRLRLIRTLFQRCFDHMHAQGYVFSALGPFSFQFYEKFGYAHAAQMMQYQFEPDDFKKPYAPDGIKAREFQEADADAVMRAQRSMARFGSRAFLRPGDLKSEHAYVFERADEIIGFTRFKFVRIGEDDLEVFINDTWFSADECLPAIFDFVYRYASQCEKITWTLDPEIPLEFYLKDPAYVTRKEVGFYMVRVVDFAAYCQQVRVPLFASEPVVIHLEDANCPWNTGVYQLTPVSGRLELQPSGKEAEISFDARHLSHALGGLLTAKRLRRVGGLACSAEAAERFTRIFPAESYVTYAEF